MSRRARLTKIYETDNSKAKQEAYEVAIAAMCGALFLASMIRILGIEI